MSGKYIGAPFYVYQKIVRFKNKFTLETCAVRRFNEDLVLNGFTKLSYSNKRVKTTAEKSFITAKKDYLTTLYSSISSAHRLMYGRNIMKIPYQEFDFRIYWVEMETGEIQDDSTMLKGIRSVVVISEFNNNEIEKLIIYGPKKGKRESYLPDHRSKGWVDKAKPATLRDFLKLFGRKVKLEIIEGNELTDGIFPESNVEFIRSYFKSRMKFQ